MVTTQKNPGKSNLPFGASPFTLVMAGLLMVVLAILYLPGLISGQGVGTYSAPRAPAPAPTPVPVPAPAPPAVQVTTDANAVAPPPTAAISPASDELSIFLLRFGRANPFAALGGGARGDAAGDSTIESLKKRAGELENGGLPAGAGASQPAKELYDGFALTGIVRYAHLALAVIMRSGKTYYVMAGEAVGKTGYVVRAINQDNVIIATGEKELVLSLRRNKP